MPRTVTAAIFKATCLKLMDEVAETGKPPVSADWNALR